MKNILVPTDFSPCADKALDYAVTIAKQANSPVLLLHACEQIHSPFQDHKTLIEEHNRSVQEHCRMQLQVVKQSIEATEGVKIADELYDGEVIDAVLEAARSHHAELIVMGTTGRTGLRNSILGSKTAALLAVSEIPVITVPYDYEWSLPRNILLTLSDPDENIHCLKPVFDLAVVFQSDVKVAIFSDTDEEAFGVMEHTRTIYQLVEKLRSAYAGTLIKQVHLSGQDFQDAVQEYTDSHNIDLLAMVTHKRNKTQYLFNKSMTRKMCNHTTIPLLSVNATA